MIGDRLNLSARPDWRSRAACRGRPTAWFFALPRTAEAELAAQVCSECSVASECAAEGRENKELGRWGEHVRLLDKYRGERIHQVSQPVASRDGLYRCFDHDAPLPFLSEGALLVHQRVCERRAG